MYVASLDWVYDQGQYMVAKLGGHIAKEPCKLEKNGENFVPFSQKIGGGPLAPLAPPVPLPLVI